MEDLKECPFCGGEATLSSNYNYKTHKYYVFAKCQFCNAEAHQIESPKDPEDDGWVKDACNMAVKAWNRRG